MKKLLAILLVLTLCLSFFACRKHSGDSTDTTTALANESGTTTALAEDKEPLDESYLEVVEKYFAAFSKNDAKLLYEACADKYYDAFYGEDALLNIESFLEEELNYITEYYCGDNTTVSYKIEDVKTFDEETTTVYAEMLACDYGYDVNAIEDLIAVETGTIFSGDDDKYAIDITLLLRKIDGEWYAQPDAYFSLSYFEDDIKEFKTIRPISNEILAKHEAAMKNSDGKMLYELMVDPYLESYWLDGMYESKDEILSIYDDALADTYSQLKEWSGDITDVIYNDFYFYEYDEYDIADLSENLKLYGYDTDKLEGAISLNCDVEYKGTEDSEYDYLSATMICIDGEWYLSALAEELYYSWDFEYADVYATTVFENIVYGYYAMFDDPYYEDENEYEDITDIVVPDFDEIEFSVGFTHQQAFHDYINENPDATVEDIANHLIMLEINLFMGGAMPIEEGTEYFPGFDNHVITGFKSCASFMPMMGSIPYVGYVFELEDGADIDAFITQLEENCNPRWQICVAADETVTDYSGNKVLFLMCPMTY